MDLIIDTSSEELKVVLVNNKDYVINKETGVKHLEHLLPEIDRLFNENNKKLEDIDSFGVVVGPGSFTGIRIGVATIKAFCSVFKRKIISINMLDLLAFVILNSNSNLKDNFGVIIKSTSTKYYFGEYDLKGDCLEQKLLDKEGIETEFLNLECIFSFNFEETFNKYKTKKIILMPGNYVSFMEHKKERNEYAELSNLKPVYLALSQAEVELLKKENNLC